MSGNKRKVVLVGTGMVGMSFAYAALNQNVCDELIMIDLNEKRAEGEAMDLNHGLAFSHSSMKSVAEVTVNVPTRHCCNLRRCQSKAHRKQASAFAEKRSCIFFNCAKDCAKRF